MAKGRKKTRGRFRRAKSRVARASSSKWGRWLMFGAGLAGVLAVGEGVSRVTGVQAGWQKGLVFVGVGLLGGMAARMLGARRLSMPLQTAGIGMAVVSALHNQVDALANKTQETLAGSGLPGLRPTTSVMPNTSTAMASYTPAPVAANKAAKPTTLDTVAALLPSLTQLGLGIASAVRQGQTPAAAPAMATMGIEDWSLAGANGLDDWESGAGLRGAGLISARDYAMVGNR